MAQPAQPRDRKDFEVAIICALRVEADAVEALFDKFWGEDGDVYGKAVGDPNAYTTGVIGVHNVVLACMPGMGKSIAASVASSFRSSFQGIRLALLVGICGGVPGGTHGEEEVLLGDVIVSTALVEYDLGRRLPGRFTRKDTLEDSLGRPNTEIRSFLAKLQGRRGRVQLKENTLGYLTALLREPGFENVRYPGVDEDKLFTSTYSHRHHAQPTCVTCANYESEGDEICTAAFDASCSELNCSDDKSISRLRLVRAKETAEVPEPWIHYGRIASGDTVMKSAKDRDEIARKENVIAFEMEGAGVWANFPCVVIKAVCDYADSHKNKKWQGYAAATAAACMKAFLKEWVLGGNSLDRTASVVSKAHFLVPFGRNNQFIGRSSVLDELLAKLNPDDLDDDCQRVAIAGLGGVGKTQIALEAAFRIQKEVPDCSILWISAVSTASFDKGFNDIGQALRIPGIDKDGADVKSLVNDFLSKESTTRWLLIIDNADDIEMLYNRTDRSIERNSSPALLDYLPYSRKGSILFTTRNQEAAVKQAGVNVIKVKEMSKGDSQKLLMTSLIDKSLIGGQDDVVKLLDNLTHLPLAIKQAAAYINQNSISVSDYLGLYEADGEDLIYLLNADFEDQGRYKETRNPIALTWLISFRQISSRDRLAEEYLCFMSCVAQQDIPHSLLPPAKRRQELEAIGILRGYGFITKREGQDSYDIHRLVQIVMRNWLTTKGEFSLWAGKALKQVFMVFPHPEYENKAIWTIYIPHAQRVLSFQGNLGDSKRYQWELLYNLGRSFYFNGNYVEAERLLRQGLEICKILLGEEDPNTLATMSSIGKVLIRQGRYAEAEQIHRQTLELDRKLSGPEHLHTLVSLGELASALSYQGKYVEAEQMERQVSELRKKILGPDHSETLASIHNLAMTLDNLGNYSESEQMHRQTLATQEKVLGREHPNTLSSKGQLASTLYRHGKYIEAEQIHRQTLELRKKILGLEHPDTLTSMHNLATTSRMQGKYSESEQMYQQTLAAKEKVLGREHPNTLASMYSLAELFRMQGKEIESVELHRQTLQLREKVLGKEHPDTIKSMSLLLRAQKDSGTAGRALEHESASAVASLPTPGL